MPRRQTPSAPVLDLFSEPPSMPAPGPPGDAELPSLLVAALPASPPAGARQADAGLTSQAYSQLLRQVGYLLFRSLAAGRGLDPEHPLIGALGEDPGQAVAAIAEEAGRRASGDPVAAATLLRGLSTLGIERLDDGTRRLSALPRSRVRPDPVAPEWGVLLARESLSAHLLRNPQAVTICDPACGEGRYLAHACRRLLASGLPAQEVLSRLAAAEEDPFLLDLARAVVYIELATPGLSEAAVRSRIAGGSGLNLAWPQVFPESQGGFRAILCEPPRGRSVPAGAPLAAGPPPRRMDIAAAYFQLCQTLVGPGGRLGLALPSGLLAAPAHTDLRAARPWGIQPVLLYLGEDVSLVVMGGEPACRVGEAGPDPPRWVRGALEDENWWRGAQDLLHPERGAQSPERGCLRDHFQVGTSMDSATARQLRPWMRDREAGPGTKLMTQGLIGTEGSRWGQRTCRFLHQVYEHPRLITRSAELPPGLAAFLERSRRPKLVVAALRDRLKAHLDAEGEYVGSPGTWTITHPANDLSELTRLRDRLHSDETSRTRTREAPADCRNGLTRAVLLQIPYP